MALFSGKSSRTRELNRIQEKLAPVLGPLGKLYGFFMDKRARRYGCLKKYRAGIPCVSIGNIALGGTGKTPLTDWFLRWAESRGKRAAVLTRGYGAKPPYYPYTVSHRSVASEAGDEPLMLALAHPSARVVVDPVRCRGAALAEHEYHPDFLVMDDGFQHLALHRDVDVVLLRPEDFMENWNKVVPAGMWRESAGALGRASVFLVRADEAAFENLEPLIRDRLKGLNAPVFSFALRAVGLEPIIGKKTAFSVSPPPSAEYSRFAFSNPSMLNANISERVHSGPTHDVSGEGAFPYLLVSGVGSPGDVRETAIQFLGRAPDEHCIFPDHHAYTERDASRIGVAAKAKNLTVVTTAKDAQKLSMVADFSFYSFMADVRFGAKSLIRDEESGETRIVGQSFDQWWERKARDLGLLDEQVSRDARFSEQAGLNKEEIDNG